MADLCVIFLFLIVARILSPSYKVTLMMQKVQAVGSATTERKNENNFQSEFVSLQNDASLSPGFKRYVQNFQVNRKLVIFSLGMVYMKNSR